MDETFKNCSQELKTSDEWYKVDTSSDIVDPDGWDRSSKNHDDWFVEKISLKTYTERRDLSSTTKFGKYKHVCPFN